MKKCKVNITYSKRSREYRATTCDGKFTLCCFWESLFQDGVWYFDIRHKTMSGILVKKISSGDGKAFPFEYFLNLLKCEWFLEFGVKEFPEIEFAKTAKKLLNIQ